MLWGLFVVLTGAIGMVTVANLREDIGIWVLAAIVVPLIIGLVVLESRVLSTGVRAAYDDDWLILGFQDPRFLEEFCDINRESAMVIGAK